MPRPNNAYRKPAVMHLRADKIVMYIILFALYLSLVCVQMFIDVNNEHATLKFELDLQLFCTFHNNVWSGVCMHNASVVLYSIVYFC